jgi:hypothetical protein
VDQKDLKQIGKLIQNNNKVLMGSVDKKFETNNKTLIGLMDRKLDGLDEKIDKKFNDNNKVLALMMDIKFDDFENRFEQKMLNWKSEIVDSVDVLAKEMRDEREFRDISSHQTANNTRRIEEIETKVFGAVQNVV